MWQVQRVENHDGIVITSMVSVMWMMVVTAMTIFSFL